jgi:fructose-1,6-bisphosphatase/inositol monophosphatase family enzyme
LQRRLHTVALEAVRAAGREQMKFYGRRQEVDLELTHDLKLAIDRRCEKVAVQILREAFPDHGIISEENTAVNPQSPYRWYLDPLDGSVNYFLGQPYFCICLACYYRPPTEPPESPDPLGKPLLGIVYAPALGQTFEAMSDGPAFCNGDPVRPGRESRLNQAVIGLSFGSEPATMQRMSAIGGKLARRSRKIRVFGATGLDLANVACGRLSGLVQGRVRVWDFAAARVILDAAGGYFRADKNGEDYWQIVGAAPGIADALQDLMDAHPAVVRRS